MQMDGTRKKKHPEWGNPDTERWAWYVLTHAFCKLMETEQLSAKWTNGSSKLRRKLNPFYNGMSEYTTYRNSLGTSRMVLRDKLGALSAYIKKKFE